MYKAPICAYVLKSPSASDIDDIPKAFEVDLGKEINDGDLTADDFKSDDDILDEEVICIFD